MTDSHSLKTMIRRTPVLGPIMYGPVRTLYHRLVLDRVTRKHWEERAADVIACADNAHIPRVAGAGEVHAGVQIMHNGIKIRTGSYYGPNNTKLLRDNAGVHEPQEEYVFQEVLRHIAAGSAMIELGAYWAFYSMWFLSCVKGGRCVMVEPEAVNLAMGRQNFELNAMRGEFVHAFVGSAPATDAEGRRTVCVDELVAKHALERVHILHSDIQGFELQMLDGAKATLDARKVDYVFISTHSQALHEACRERLLSHAFEIIADADMANTYSFDGLIAARRRELPGQGPVKIAQKSAGLGNTPARA